MDATRAGASAGGEAPSATEADPAALVPPPDSLAAELDEGPVAGAASAGNGSGKPVDEQALDEFLATEALREMEREVSRVLASFKLNPFDVLGLPLTASPDDAVKQFRERSLLVHPDKVPAGLRERAQKAFQLLNAAKRDMEDPEKLASLNAALSKARALVTAERDELAQKQLLEFKRQHGSSVPAPAPKFSSTFEEEVAAKLKEVILEAEFRKRQLLKAAAQAESEVAASRERMAKEAEERLKEQKDWEEGREKRVSSWRDFNKKQLQKKRPLPFQNAPAASDARDVRPRLAPQ
jgi:DnaJ family protein C protein 8